MASLGAETLGAQRSTPVAATFPWSVDAQYLQLNGGALGRDATPSLSVVLGRELRRSAGTNGLSGRAEAGWLRAVRPSMTAQGATAGMSVGVGMPGTDGSRLTIRPGVAVLAGWAEVQDSTSLYSWVGAPSTPAAGTSGTAYSWFTKRSRAFGAGMSLGGELRLSPAIGVTGSLQHWRFSGDAISTQRSVTMAGIGVVTRPQALALDLQRWWHALKPSGQQASATPERGR